MRTLLALSLLLVPIDAYAQIAPLVERGSADSTAAIADVEVVDGFAYVLDGAHLRTFDVHDPAHPVALPRPLRVGRGVAIRQVTADILYVLGEQTKRARTFGSVTAYRITRPGTLRTAGSVRLPDVGSELHVVGSTAYVPTGTGGLVVIDASRPTRPRILSTMMLGADSVVSVAVAAPTMWAVLGRWRTDTTPTGPARVMVSGLALAVCDLTAPNAPVLTREIAVPEGINSFTVHNGIGYAMRGTSDLVSLDLSAPGAPEIGRVHFDRPRNVLRMAGGRLYAGSGAALSVLDVRVPTRPRVIAEGSLSDALRNVRVVGDLAFVAAYQRGGLRIFVAP